MVQKVGSSHSKSEYILQKCMIYSQAKKSVAFERFVGLFPYLCTYIHMGILVNCRNSITERTFNGSFNRS